jgi:hypothetical protein
MDDSFIGALEKRIKDVADLRHLINDMKHTLSEVKINVDDLKNFEKGLDDALKFTLQIKELDEWTVETLKLFKEISNSKGFRIKGKKLKELKVKEFVDVKKAKDALLERGFEILPDFEPKLSKILNSSISMALDFLVSKESAIENAQKLIAPYRKPEK